MADLVEVKGHCLCNSVTVTAKVKNEIGACHCEMCRRWSAGPILTFLHAEDVVLGGQDMIEHFDSSEWAERGFCKRCGSHLFYRLKENNGYHLPVGLFENVDEVKFTTQIYVDSKPAYYSFANETVNMTEADVLAYFSATLED